MNRYYRIWNIKRKKWWKINQHGYVNCTCKNCALVVSFNEAFKIVTKANAYGEEDLMIMIPTNRETIEQKAKI